MTMSKRHGGFFAAAILLVGAACASGTTPGTLVPSPEGGGLDGAAEVAPTDAEAATDGDGGPDICALTRAYEIECNGVASLTCGAKFDGWCAELERLNSDAYRRAERLCLVKENCTNSVRRQCEYRSYGGAQRSRAQDQVVAALCAACEPNDPVGCASRTVTFDPDAGRPSYPFIVAWELADSLVNEMRVKCTGTMLSNDAGADTCTKAFNACAGQVYLSHVPQCP